MPSLTRMKQVLVAGQIVSHVVMGLPSSKQWEAWTQLYLHVILVFDEIAGGDIADLVAVVHIGGGGGKDGLQGMRDQYWMLKERGRLTYTMLRI